MRMLATAIAAVLASGCQMSAQTPPAAPTAVPQPTLAVLTSGDAAAMDALKAALAKAMGQAKVELGPGDPTRSPVISVLPRQPGMLEDRSLAMPTIFRLTLEGGACFVVRESDGVRQRIEGAACKAAP